MLRRDGFLPKSTSAAPVKSVNPGEAAGKPDSLTSCTTIITRCIDTLNDVFSMYPDAESAFQVFIHAAKLDKGISGKGTDFHFRKERLLILLHLLMTYKDLNMKQTISLRDAVLDNKDNMKALKLLKTFAPGEKTGWSLVFWRGREVVLTKEESRWRDANDYASSVSDSGFLSYLKTIPDANYLHDAAVKCEEAAYTGLKTQLDSLVLGISQKIFSIQEEQCNCQLKDEVMKEEEKELKVSRVEFSRKIEDLSRGRSKS
jgi:hypothetical protein